MIGRETNDVGLRARSSIASVFATPTLAALLSQFAVSPDASFYQRELVERTGGSLYLVQRELKRLEQAGLIAREQRGRQVEYRFNTTHPAAAGLRDAVLKTLASTEILREAMNGIGGVRAAFVFGSIAEGTAGPDSDLDVLVIGEAGLRSVSQSLMPALRETGREPNLVVMTPDEARARIKSDDHFMTTVLAGPKLWLVGDDAELERLLG